MAAGVAQMHHIFGLKPSISGNVAFQDEQHIIYPAGSHLVVHNLDQRNQSFIPFSDKSTGVTVICVSPNQRYAAIAEKGGEKPVVNIYDLQTFKKRKVLSLNEITAKEFTAIAFSPDSKYLLTQSGEPEWHLAYWAWEKSKVMASLRVPMPGANGFIYQVSFNPQDTTQVCVVGNNVLKLLRYSEGTLKQFALQKLEGHHYLCHGWMPDEKLLVGADNGRILVIEGGELKKDFTLTLTDGKEDGERRNSEEMLTSSGFSQKGLAVTAIATYKKGFIVAGGVNLGSVFLYEKTDDKDYFRRTRQIQVPLDSNTTDPAKWQEQTIQGITISPSEDTVIVSTDKQQLFQVHLSNAEFGKGDVTYFNYVFQSTHYGIITGLDICIRKPLIATSSTDRSIRVWNYETRSLELYKEFAEEANSVALHPSGLYLLVGFSDKLRLMNLLIDDIKTFKEFTVRNCNECAFSNGGHLFAAVNGNMIQIYSTATFETHITLKGHNGKVRSVLWSQDDTRLFSCGMDGAVYEWDVSNGKRVSESVLKACNYSSVAISADAKSAFAVGSDQKLKEISDSQITREIPSEDEVLTQVMLSRSGKMLFCGTGKGSVRSYKFPLSEQAEFTDYLGHSKPITKMKITHTDETLVTVAEDGSMILWKVTDKEGRKRDREIPWAEEILITKTDLEEKNQAISELRSRADELKSENEYQLRLKEMNYSEKIKELTEKFIQEMESLKTKNQVLKNEKEKEESRHEEELNTTRERNERELRDLESANNEKLIREYDKFQEVQKRSQKMQEDYERQIQEMEEKRELALAEQTEYYERKIDELKSKLGQTQDENHQQVKEYEETKRQIEEDGDVEVLTLKNKYEQLLKDIRTQNEALKTELSAEKKKAESQSKDVEQLKETNKKLESEKTKLNNVIKNLEKEIAGKKKEIQERDETIQDKEKRIYDLKKKNQELEKFKFVLDYKIKELRKQIEPKDDEIKNQKEQIQEMENELERFNKNNTKLELNIAEFREKLASKEKELHAERQRVRDLESLLRRFKTDLHNCIGYIQDPKMLKESIKALYQKHVHDDAAESASVDNDIQSEYARQREHLERTVAGLKKKLTKDVDLHKQEKVAIMQENVTLIKEINDLRRELKLARSQIFDLESALGLTRKKSGHNTEQLVAAIYSKKGTKEVDEKVSDQERIIEMQRSEIRKMRQQLTELDGIIRPNSSSRLPPLDRLDTMSSVDL